MLPVPGYRAFSDIVEEAAKSAHDDWWVSHSDDYWGYLVGDVWLGRFKDCLYYREVGERKPSPITRDVVLNVIPTAMTVADNDHPPYPPTPWPKLAEIPFKYYDSGERGSFAKLNLSATKAQEWIEAHSAPDPATDQYTPVLSHAGAATLRGSLRRWLEAAAQRPETVRFVKSDFLALARKETEEEITDNLWFEV
ncbi:MAG: hypothetical protein O7F75_11690, partial [Alphaproteobacteria bacterium]|nr:hypothetical protein [Alphaproteobacteria bacterium]